jgi:hypothetical protein
MMFKTSLSAASLLMLLAVCQAQQPLPAVKLEGGGDVPHITNGHVEQRSARAGLATAVQQLAKSAAGPLWVGYAVPATGASRRLMCCFDNHEFNAAGCCAGCRLESGGNSFFNSDSGDCVAQAAPTHVFVLLRFAEGKLTRVRPLTPDCGIDAAETSVTWLNDVNPAESVAYLLPLAQDTTSSTQVQHMATAALALHADASADAALEKLIAPGQPEKTRENAVFWMASERGRRVLPTLLKLARDDQSDRFRQHLTFALSTSKEPEAQQELIRMAHQDAAGSVRGQALFWLAQKAGKKMAGEIASAIENDPDTDVKKKAVFALAQLPDNEGVPKLIDLAKRHPNAVVRKQAIFWLGQSKDPRALLFIEDILTR